MEPFALINDHGIEIMVDVTTNGKIAIVIDPDPFNVNVNWRRIQLTEDEAKAVRRALMTAIAKSKKG